MKRRDIVWRLASPTRLLAVLILLAVSPAAAGVVIVQKTTAPDGKGGTKTTNATTTIEGSKEKLVTDNTITLIDLEKGTMVNMNPSTKTATEFSFLKKDGTGSALAAGMMSNFNATFTPTGAHKTIAGYKCDEYNGKGKFMVDFTMTSCFSKDAPGAAEYDKFTKRMMEALGAKGPASMPGGIVLLNEMVMQPMMSAESIAKMSGSLPPEAVQKMAEAAKPRRTVSEVTSVKVESVAADAFAVPEGYKVQSIDAPKKN